MKSPRSSSSNSERGSVFIFTFWLLLILSIFTLAVGHAVRQKIKVLGHLETRQELRYIAEAGVKTARNILNRKDIETSPADALRHDWSQNKTELHDMQVGRGAFSVMKYAYGQGDYRYADAEDRLYGVVDEESKLNINTVSKPQALKHIFKEAVRLSDETAMSLAESIMDWRDADSDSYPGGAERRYYNLQSPPYVAKNANYDALEEILFVKGMTPEIFQKVRPYLTIHGSGKVNVNTAPAHVLRAVGFGPATTKKIMSYRAGRDNKVGTLDDGTFTSLDSIVPALTALAGLDEAEVEQVTNLVAQGAVKVLSDYFEIISVARLPSTDQALLIRCVAQRNGTVALWNEIFV